MIEKKITVTDPNGLHTRPAKKLVDTAKTFQSDITLVKGDKEGNAKNLIKLMKLGIVCGTEITVRCAGSDEQAALEAVMKIISEMAD
jgi:phosphotransferase system HPr (HPr) family protein